MKKLLFALLVSTGGTLSAQTFVGMTFSAPTPPTADAGNDTVVLPSTSVQLNGVASGGTAPFTYQWSPASAVSDPTIANPVATVSTTTPLTLVVTDANGCKDTALVTIFVSGLSTTDLGTAFGITPNPGNGLFRFNATATSGTVSLIDAQGRILKSESYGGGSLVLDYTAFPQGLYSVLFQSQEGTSVQRISILKP